MTVKAAVRELAERLAARAREVLRVAAASPPGGGGDWEELAASVAVPILSFEERVRYLGTPPLQQGALPIEVRRVLERVRDLALDELAAVRDLDADDGGDELEVVLRCFVESRMREYIQTIRPPQGAGGIFRNALATTPRYAVAEAGMSTLRCSMCGAARLDAKVEHCQFCGASLFPMETRA